MDVAVKLEIFEGPLDLLLHLIRKSEVDIHDIPIALITKQYLEYLDLMRDLNISMAGDFLVMAATLAHIKSRTLLPSLAANATEEEGEDPRSDLVSQLMEHQRIKEAALRLDQRPWLDRDVFGRGAGKQEVNQALAGAQSAEAVAVGLFDLIEAFRRLLTHQDPRSGFTLPAAQVSLEERMGLLLESLRRHQTITFEECFQGQRGRGDLVVTFLAILELTRLGLVRVFQQRADQAQDGPVDWGTLRIYFMPLDREETAEEQEP
ncbi:MAG: segregation/condensation protein A [Pseudomonadota bacterium]